MTIFQQIKQQEYLTHELYHQYGAQVKVCNSDESTVKDFTLLTQIRKEWERQTQRLDALGTELNNYYENNRRLKK